MASASTGEIPSRLFRAQPCRSMCGARKYAPRTQGENAKSPGQPLTPARGSHVAIWGLKDCHVLVYDTAGNRTRRSVVELGLETAESATSKQSIVLGAAWMPHSAVRLAVFTNTALRVYDLSTDVVFPVYSCSISSK
jgi:hypothetical protein